MENSLEQPYLQIFRELLPSPSEEKSVVVPLGQELSEHIKAYCTNQNITPFILFQALTHVLLYRYTGQQDLIIGSAFAGRDSVHLEKQPGNFANILPVRARIEGPESFKAFLGRLRSDIFDIYKHQSYPFSQLLKDLNLSFDNSHSPILILQLASRISKIKRTPIRIPVV